MAGHIDPRGDHAVPQALQRLKQSKLKAGKYGNVSIRLMPSPASAALAAAGTSI